MEVEYAVLSEKNIRDLMRMYNRFNPHLPLEEIQGRPVWKKNSFGLYLREMVQVEIFPMNEALDNLDTLPTIFGQYPGVETGIMSPALWKRLEAFLHDHALGGIFTVSSEVVEIQISYPQGKIKDFAREIVSFNRELTGDEFGSMRSIRRIYGA